MFRDIRLIPKSCCYYHNVYLETREACIVWDMDIDTGSHAMDCFEGDEVGERTKLTKK
jgi:hypothetical protein